MGAVFAAAVPASTVALRTIEGFPVVSAVVGSTPVTFLFDTGAEGHLIRPEAQAVLGLPVLPGTTPVFGTGGAAPAPLVRLEQVWLGDVRLDPAPTPVLPLPLVPAVRPLLAGLLGEPLLDRFDLLLHAAGGRLSLFPAGEFGPPFDPVAIVPLGITSDRQILLPVLLNGTALTALLDTGSRATLLTEAAAGRLGLAMGGSANTARGVDGERLPVGHVRVDQFAVGADVRRDAPVSIAPIAAGAADLLLGFDYLQTRMVWISAATQRLAIGRPLRPA